MNESNGGYDLQRFVQAQHGLYEQALAEIRRGRKRTHWMWFVFPQMAGLGSSSFSLYYGIASLAEAEAYLRHPLLGPRLVACCEALLTLGGLSALDIFGSPDDRKLRSCLTLFSQAQPGDSIFARTLRQYFRGEADSRTLQLIQDAPTA